MLFARSPRDDQLRKVFPQNIRAAATKHCFCRGIPFHYLAFVVHRDDGVQRGFEDRFIASLHSGPRRLGLFPL